MSIPQSWSTGSCSVKVSSSNCRNLYYWKLWFKLKSCSTAAPQKELFFKFKLKTRPAHWHIVTASRLTKQCNMKNKQFSISDKLSFQPLTTRSTHKRLEKRTCVKIHFYEFPVSYFANRAHSYQWFWITFFYSPKVTPDLGLESNELLRLLIPKVMMVVTFASLR